MCDETQLTNQHSVQQWGQSCHWWGSLHTHVHLRSALRPYTASGSVEQFFRVWFHSQVLKTWEENGETLKWVNITLAGWRKTVRLSSLPFRPRHVRAWKSRNFCRARIMEAGDSTCCFWVVSRVDPFYEDYEVKWQQNTKQERTAFH